MATRRRQSDIDENKYRRMLREARGQGTGAAYRPWKRVDEGTSLGRCHRTASSKTGYRIHHLRSNLEYFAYLEYWWDEAVEDIREHYPLLPLQRTLDIARALGVRHPRNPRTAFWIPQTIDFLVTTREGFRAAAVMEDADWHRPRTRQTSDIAQAFLAEEGIALEIVLASQLRTQRSRNLIWIYDARAAQMDPPILLSDTPMVGDMLRVVARTTGVSSRELARRMDGDWHAPVGTALALIRRLLAERILVTDINLVDISRGCMLALGAKWYEHF
jgi:hypothetical protein